MGPGRLKENKIRIRIRIRIGKVILPLFTRLLRGTLNSGAVFVRIYLR